MFIPSGITKFKIYFAGNAVCYFYYYIYKFTKITFVEFRTVIFRLLSDRLRIIAYCLKF